MPLTSNGLAKPAISSPRLEGGCDGKSPGGLDSDDTGAGIEFAAGRRRAPDRGAARHSPDVRRRLDVSRHEKVVSEVYKLTTWMFLSIIVAVKPNHLIPQIDWSTCQMQMRRLTG